MYKTAYKVKFTYTQPSYLCTILLIYISNVSLLKYKIGYVSKCRVFKELLILIRLILMWPHVMIRHSNIIIISAEINL